MRHVDQRFVGRVRELGRIVVVIIRRQPSRIGMGVEMQDRQGTMCASDGSHLRQAYRAVAPKREWNAAGIENPGYRPLDSLERIMNASGGEPHIAGIDNPLERVDVGVFQESAGEDRGLADGVRPQAGPETGRGETAIERDAEHGSACSIEVLAEG